jgi:aminopeptidase YwaD
MKKFICSTNTLFFLLFGLSNIAYGQPGENRLRALVKNVSFLADDRLEGRRAGSNGEKLAADFIAKQFKRNRLRPLDGLDKFFQPFEINDGLTIEPNSSLKIGNAALEINQDFIPMPFSNTGEAAFAFNSLQLYNINDLIQENEGNPHFDFNDALYQKIKSLYSCPNAAIVLFNGKDTVLTEKFDAGNKKAKLACFVLYVSPRVAHLLEKENTDSLHLNVNIIESKRTGHNVAGFINNNAEKTIVIGAHYDHLGYGEDKNSLYVGKEKQIHNGADDNASGTAALLLLSKELNNKKYGQYNYALVAFSGEELGLYGSKYFVEHPPLDLKKVSYMINMDMVGRFNDSTKGLTIGGFGTSPQWGNIINTKDEYFKIKIDSAGSGPSDHTSFYRKDIPVLFFFTGTHSDYHKPSDDADKINYNGELKIVDFILAVIERSFGYPEIVFSKTREAAPGGKSSFKVTMGIMPDYTYSGVGVLVDGVSDNRPAQKAGIKAGDVIQQLGSFVVEDVQSYMQALNKFKKGDETEVKIKRGNEAVLIKIIF